VTYRVLGSDLGVDERRSSPSFFERRFLQILDVDFSDFGRRYLRFGVDFGRFLRFEASFFIRFVSISLIRFAISRVCVDLGRFLLIRVVDLGRFLLVWIESISRVSKRLIDF